MSPVAVIFPCYNEKKRLECNHLYLVELASRSDLHLIFVDDASFDGSLVFLSEFQKRFPHSVSVLRLPKRMGKGEAVRAGLVQALTGQFEYVGYCDADLPVDLPEFIAFLESGRLRGLDIVWGARDHFKRPWQRGVHGYFFSHFAKLLFRLPANDPQCGLKLFRKTQALSRALNLKFRTKWLFDIEVYLRFGPSEVRVGDFKLSSWRHVKGSKFTVMQWPQAVLEVMRLMRIRFS